MSTLADLLISENGAADSAEASQRKSTQEAAETLYQRVIAIDHADLAPRAAYLLGELRRRSGERIGAEEMLQTALLSAHPIYAPLAEKALEEAGEFDASDAVEDLLVQIFNAREQLSLGRDEREDQSVTSSSLDAAVAWHRHRVGSGGMCAMGTFEVAEANALVLASIRRLLAVRLLLIERQPLRDRLLVSVRTSECSLKVEGHRDSPSALPVIYQQPGLGTASRHCDVTTPGGVVAPAAISSGLFVRERCEYIFTPRFNTCADPTS